MAIIFRHKAKATDQLHGRRATEPIDTLFRTVPLASDDEVFDILSQEFNNSGQICDIVAEDGVRLRKVIGKQFI